MTAEPATESPAAKPQTAPLTVAVTGPTGDIGRSLIQQLEGHSEVERIIGMARRPFSPTEHGWQKTEYRRGDVLDQESVRALVNGADVVVHLAFIIFGSRQETRSVNLSGTRNVFEAAVAAGARRLVYTSSVAAYGFSRDRQPVLTEDVPPVGTDEFYYSAQKAELEALLKRTLRGATTAAYIFRPCIVGGRDALLLIEDVVRQFQLGGRTGVGRRLIGLAPGVRPALPDNGVPFQLVHHDDVAGALAAAVIGRGTPGIYNLAAQDTITMADVAAELGWLRIPVPDLAVSVASNAIKRIPGLPTGLDWIHALRVPSMLDTSKAQAELGWQPRFSTRETLKETIEGARRQHLVD